MVVGYGDPNTWNTFPVSELKITLSNQTTTNWMKKLNRTKNK
jgi:hypothetical protein